MRPRVEAPLPRTCFLGHSDRGPAACLDADSPRALEAADVEGAEVVVVAVAEVVEEEVVAVYVAGLKLLRWFSLALLPLAGQYH